MSTNRLDYYRQEVDDLIIEVQVRGVPTPKIVWSRDGVELDVENSEKFFVMREPDGIYKLCIHDPQKMDGGRFIVEASNKAGKEEIRRTIRFLGKEHYKYLPGIHHADPKQPHEREEGDVPFVEPEPEAPAAPESDEPEMVKEKVYQANSTSSFNFRTNGATSSRRRRRKFACARKSSFRHRLRSWRKTVCC